MMTAPGWWSGFLDACLNPPDGFDPENQEMNEGTFELTAALLPANLIPVRGTMTFTFTYTYAYRLFTGGGMGWVKTGSAQVV
jgi:hypothetical protein